MIQTQILKIEILLKMTTMIAMTFQAGTNMNMMDITNEGVDPYYNRIVRVSKKKTG